MLNIPYLSRLKKYQRCSNYWKNWDVWGDTSIQYNKTENNKINNKIKMTQEWISQRNANI